MLAAAKALGIDPALQPEYVWIAETAASAKTPPGWQEVQDCSGITTYVHSRLRLSQTDHPLFKKFKLIYDSQLKFAKTRGLLRGNQRVMQIEETVSRLINLALNNLLKDSLPMDPPALEELCLSFNIDSTCQFHQAHSLKQSFETFCDRQFAIMKAVSVKFNAQDFITVAREVLVKAEISENFTEILLCQECDKKAARLKCDQCKDFFCNECFSSTHAMGKRKAHETSTVSQTVCSICDCRTATMDLLNGTSASKLTCDTCYTLLVSENADVSNYHRRLLFDLVCSECLHHTSNLVCKDCYDLFCFECHTKLHIKGKRQYHQVITIDDQGAFWSHGSELPPHAVHALLDACKERACLDTAWIKFQDGLYYNLSTKAITTSISL